MARLLFDDVRFEEGGGSVVRFADAIVSSTSQASKVRVKEKQRKLLIPGRAAAGPGANAPRTIGLTLGFAVGTAIALLAFALAGAA